MASDVVIVGLGALTPLGQDMPQTAASVRAGLAAFEESAIMGKSFTPLTLATLPDDALPELIEELQAEPSLTFRESRMLRLASAALTGALEPLGELIETPPLYLGLPDMETNIQLDELRIIDFLARQVSDVFNRQASAAIKGGRSAGLTAIHRAAEDIRSGKSSLALAGGVDSYFDLYILSTLDMENRLNTELTMDGFIPGEGAAIAALSTRERAAQSGWEIMGTIQASAVGVEAGHMFSEEPYKGEGLASTVQSTLSGYDPAAGKVATIFSSMNGENHFAKEWGVTYLRASDKIAEDYRIEHPADCLGDTGAACGPIMLGLALTGIAAGYLQGPALAYASSDGPGRAACLLSGN